VAEAPKSVEIYEERNKKSDIDSTRQVAEYFVKINTPKPSKEKKPLTKEILFNLFDKNYFEQNKVKYSREVDSLENLKPLIYYFIGDYENFKKCENVSKLSVPSFSKGLLLIGGYGNGKTSVMKALQTSLAHTNVSFRTKTANDAVGEFEACPDNEHKEEFWKTYNN